MDLIKIRVWDNLEKTMHYNVAVVGDFLILEHDEYMGELSISNCVKFNPKRYKIMPYVQKVDDSFPMYLGDIVEHHTENEGIQIGMIVVEGGTYFYVTHRQVEGILEYLKIPVMWLVDFEIVGNVYETAHLLA